MPSLKTDHQVMELFKDPKKCYSAFAKAITQDAEKENFEAIDNQLLYFNQEVNDSSTNQDGAMTDVINEIVDQGIIEMVFVKMISNDQPIIAPPLTKSLTILLETISNIINISDIAKLKSSIFLPYLMRNIVGISENECRLRIDAAKLINTLLENVDSSNSDQTNEMKKQKNIREGIGTLLSNADDFELQALILEMVFRLIPPSERDSYASTWFDCKELQQLFASIEDKCFEPGCRRFLNKLNNGKTEKRIYSIPCQKVFFGNQKVSVAKDNDSNKYWIDFNLGSRTLKFFVEEKEDKDDDTWWHTVVITADNVSSCIFLEPHHYGSTIKITLKDDAAKLIPSLPERGEHSVFIRLEVDSKYNQRMLSDILHKMKWVKTEFLSPKSSVAISVVHVANRQKGSMKILPSITAKPPKALMEEDDHDSDYPSSITGQSPDASSQPTSQSSSQKQDSQELNITVKPDEGQTTSKNKKSDSIVSKEKEGNQDKLKVNDNESRQGLRSRGKRSVSPQSGKNGNDNDRADIQNSKSSRLSNEKEKGHHSSEEKNKKKKIATRKKTSGYKSSDMDSGADTSSSRGSGRRSRSKNAKSPQPKKTKSPLPVEIKGASHSKSSNSTSTDDDKEFRTLSNSTKKSAFDIAKGIQRDTSTSKIYPKAFNVAKRMEAMKGNLTGNMSRSQELTKKVFGQKGRSFNQSVSLPSKVSSSPPKDSLNAGLPQSMPVSKSKGALSKTKEKSSDESSGNNDFGFEEDEVEVIQDSLPLDDSPEMITRRRSDIPIVRHRSVLEERLVKSAPPIERTKKHSVFEHVPARLATILRKGGRDSKSSLLIAEEHSGWGSSTSSSTSTTSETDWPGPSAEPGPKPRHSLVPKLSIREKKGARTRAQQEKAIRKRASISPGLSVISEEQTPKDSRKDDPDDLVAVELSSRKKEKSAENPNTDDTVDYSHSKPRAHSTRQEKEVTNRQNNEEKTRRKNQEDNGTIEDFPLDLPDLEIDRTRKDAGQKSPQNDKNDAIVFVDEKSLQYGTSSKHSHKRKAEDSSNDTQDDEEVVSKGDMRKKQYRTRKNNQTQKSLDQSDLDIYGLHDKYEVPKRTKSIKATSHGKEKTSMRHSSDDEIDDHDDKHEVPMRAKASKVTSYGKGKNPKKQSSDDKIDDYHDKQELPMRAKTSKATSRSRETDPKHHHSDDDIEDLCDTEFEVPSRIKTLNASGRGTSYTNPNAQLSAKKGKPKPATRSRINDAEKSKGLVYDIEDDFESIQDIEKENKLINTDIKMLTPPRAEKRKKERKTKTTLSSTRINQSVNDNEDNEALKLRQFCENISSGRKVTSTPASKKFDELMEEYEKDLGNDYPEKELSSYSDVETEPSKRQKHRNNDKKVSKMKEHEMPRLSPSITHVTTNERFGRLQANNPSKWKTPEQSRLDDSGIGSASAGSHKSLLKSKRARQKGELLVTKSVSKTPITPRTSAIMKRIDEEQSNVQNVVKPRRKSQKFVDWTSSGPSKQYQNDEEDEDEEYVQTVPKRLKEKTKNIHNPNIKPRKLFKEQHHVSFGTFDEQVDQNETYRSSDDSVVGDITNIMSDLEGVLNDRLRRKRNHLQRFCKKTFDVTLQTVSNHLEQSLASRDQLVDTFNDQFLNEMNNLKDEMEKTKKNEQEIMTRIQEDMRILKTARVIQEKKVKSLQNMCTDFQSDLINDSRSHYPDQQGALQDNIRQELISIQRDFMREAQSQDRENLRRSLRSVLDVTMM